MNTLEIVILLITVTFIFSVVITALVKYLDADKASSVLSTLLRNFILIDIPFLCTRQISQNPYPIRVLPS